MADSMENCRAMLRAARATGRTCVIARTTATTRHLDDAGLVHPEDRRDRPGQGGFLPRDGFRRRVPHTMDYPLLVDMAIHHFDLIRCITGLDAVAVRGVAWNPPVQLQGRLLERGGLRDEQRRAVVYNASWCAKGSFSPWNANWQIEGAKGTIVCQGDQVTLHACPSSTGSRRASRCRSSPRRSRGSSTCCGSSSARCAPAPRRAPMWATTSAASPWCSPRRGRAQRAPGAGARSLAAGAARGLTGGVRKKGAHLRFLAAS